MSTRLLDHPRLTVVCCHCHRVRVEDASWEHRPTDAAGGVSHGLCPDCLWELYPEFAPAILSAHVDRLILIGEEMRPLDEALDGSVAVERVTTVDEATERLREAVRPGDAVLVKASNSVGLAKLVESMAREPSCST